MCERAAQYCVLLHVIVVFFGQDTRIITIKHHRCVRYYYDNFNSFGRLAVNIQHNPAILFICVASLLVDNAASLRTFSLEELIPLRAELYPERLSVQWISDSEYIYTDNNEGIKKYNAATDSTTILLDDVDMAGLGYNMPTTFSDNAKYLLLVANKRKVYRYSSFADYSVYDLATKTIQKIGNGQLQVVVWGPNNSLAYVQKNNVFYVPNAGRPYEEYQLTTDGKPGEIYNGVCDWIYEEEIFNAAEALWFSPDGDYLAVASFNDTNVESASFPLYGRPTILSNQYPQMVYFRYPKAGRTNPNVGLAVYNLKDLKQTRQTFSPPLQFGSDVIIARINWPTNNTLLTLWLNRRQNVGVLASCIIENGRCITSLVKEYKELNGWIDITDPVFDSSGKTMLELMPMPYEDRRFVHATRFGLSAHRTDDLTPSNATAQKILGWNEDNDEVYLMMSPGSAPWLKQLWSSKNGVTKCLSCSLKQCSSVSAAFSPGAKYAIVTCTADNVPPKIYLFKSKDGSFKLLNDNTPLATKLAGYNMPMSVYNMMPLQRDSMSLVKLMLPPKMEPGKKYPMIVRVYAGPGTGRVKDTFELEYATYLSTNRSFIVAAIDVRGSDALGVDAMFAVNNQLGTYEITDTLLAIKRILELYPFIDKSRVGVWGWSYGGFTSTMMLIKDKERTLACAAAVAPVTSWLYYDSIYTERYMDTPQANPSGYNQSDLMLHAEQLRDRKYLLIHGTGDDNVHYQNSMLLAKTLQHADIPFEQMSYADENHSLLGVSRHFYHTLDRFWSECFQ